MAALIGIDIGQKRDPTAICVAESENREVGVQPRQTVHFLVRHLERLPLGTPYPKVTSRIGEIVAGVEQRGYRDLQIYVDATGVGLPIVDLLRQEVPQSRVKPVYFTYGDRRKIEAGEIKLGKGYLVSRLQALLQTGCLHFPRTPESEALAQELLDYEIRVDQNANDRYGAFRVGAHDDLVTAVGLAVQANPARVDYYLL